MTKPKTFTLMGADGLPYASASRGQLGGNGLHKIYGHLDCSAARRALSNPEHAAVYIQHRVFFADEATAVAAGFRPCGTCIRPQYKVWKAAQEGK
ncbi:MAG: metal-binding protein [Tessaracoccus sp.]|uniref:metal-binding protein n=1 Tax=Tessaracoccus sp. TaxID=1971211 RepID=UPI001ED340E5|nr:metal-binding protein [Tessaracoccus sp.]MBK7820493.1 metal-binding protein [Tessaracoccus sp.]